MSVKVSNLVKIYGDQRAVNDISFEAHKGEILGFLGPNGAGKTTTMKIITCFIPKTDGNVNVCGYDVEKDTIEVRKRIGYLPEHNPLYKDMYIREYLLFIAGLHRVERPTQAVEEMIERTGLTRERHKLIGSLSKGYRQRVGLAQAMLHNPDVLILDEPTSGLDPNQLVEIRHLIKDLGKEKTVIFSSHIMQEVQALCDRVVIINKGKLVADDTIATLQQKVAGEILLNLEFNKDVSLSLLQRINGVRTAIQKGQHQYQLATAPDVDIRSLVFQFAIEYKLILLEMYRETFDIENVFQKLTNSGQG